MTGTEIAILLRTRSPLDGPECIDEEAGRMIPEDRRRALARSRAARETEGRPVEQVMVLLGGTGALLLLLLV